MDETIIGNLCANCKWEVVAEWDDIYEIYRCSDCGSEVCEEAKSFEELKEVELIWASKMPKRPASEMIERVRERLNDEKE